MSKFSFLPKYHIRSAATYGVVLRQGKRLSHNGFVFTFLKHDRGYPRLGMMIGKKYCRLAVRRNHIRRVIRERFRYHQRELMNIDLVVTLKTSMEKISDQEQTQCIEQLFLELITRSAGVVSP